MNDQIVATAPFAVVEPNAPIVNQPPLPIRWVALAPAAPTPVDVPMCRVTPGSLYRRDPDYDLVRYRYRWFVREVLVRDVTSAALADAIPSGVREFRVLRRQRPADLGSLSPRGDGTINN